MSRARKGWIAGEGWNVYSNGKNPLPVIWLLVQGFTGWTSAAEGWKENEMKRKERDKQDIVNSIPPQRKQPKKWKGEERKLVSILDVQSFLFISLAFLSSSSEIMKILAIPRSFLTFPFSLFFPVTFLYFKKSIRWVVVSFIFSFPYPHSSLQRSYFVTGQEDFLFSSLYCFLSTSFRI